MSSDGGGFFGEMGEMSTVRTADHRSSSVPFVSLIRPCFPSSGSRPFCRQPRFKIDAGVGKRLPRDRKTWKNHTVYTVLRFKIAKLKPCYFICRIPSKVIYNLTRNVTYRMYCAFSTLITCCVLFKSKNFKTL